MQYHCFLFDYANFQTCFLCFSIVLNLKKRKLKRVFLTYIFKSVSCFKNSLKIVYVFFTSLAHTKILRTLQTKKT